MLERLELKAIEGGTEDESRVVHIERKVYGKAREDFDNLGPLTSHERLMLERL